MGDCEITLAEIASESTLSRLLKNGPSAECGKILIRSEEQGVCLDEIKLLLSGSKLDKKDFFGSSDPFLAFYRINENNSRTVVHRTEFVRNNLDPRWKAMTLSVSKLVNGDYDRPLIISCIDWNRSGREKLIGEVSVTLNDLIESYRSGYKSFKLVNPKKTHKKKYSDSGKLIVENVEVEKIPSFLDYIRTGTNLNCYIAIDFTASNGDPSQPDSLHYCTSTALSQYALAIQAVGEVIRDYDRDNIFPAFGFGARIPHTGETSHCFPLNLQTGDPNCYGIEGVMDAYMRTRVGVKFFGPTNFAPIIRMVSGITQQITDGSQYSILLIITDGIISDMPQTKEAIVKAASLPLSIIIVGVGDADFSEMRVLDGDDVRISSRGAAAVRDIVQFVAFRDVYKSHSIAESKRLLTKEVLAEIPSQVVSFMHSSNIRPSAPPPYPGY